MNLEHLSASRIGTFDQCQGKYHAQYVEGLQGEPHPLTDMGSAVHLMFEKATKQLIEARDKQWDLYVCPTEFKEEACQECNVLPEHLGLVDQLTQNALDWGYFRNINRCYGAEVEFNLVLPDGTKAKGFIDRLDVWEDMGEVIDLKTQKRAFESETLPKNWQARIYNLASRNICESIKGKVKVSFWVLRHQVQPVWLSADDAKRTTDDLMAKADEIRSVKDPDYSPSGLCPWCPKYDTCPAAKEGVGKRFRRKMGK